MTFITMEEALFEDRLYYCLRRAENTSQTLLFIHGLSGSSSAWHPFADYFANEYTTLSVDLRGHGKSYRPESYDEYSIEKNAEDVRRLMAQLDMHDVVLVSHSLGTLIALELLRTSSHFVATIFISVNYEIHRGVRGSIQEPLTLAAATIARFVPAMHKSGIQLDYSKYRNTGDWNVRRMAADIPNTGLHAYLYSLAQANAYSAHADWAAKKIPTLLIHGADDSAVPVAQAMKLAGEIGASLRIIPHANHVLILNDTNIIKVEHIIEEFLKTLRK